jgi:hypothetical protein
MIPNPLTKRDVQKWGRGKKAQKQQIFIGCILDGCSVLEVIQQFVSTPPRTDQR